VDLQTFTVKETGFPTMQNNECHSNIVLGDPAAQKQEESYPWFVQTASAVPTAAGFLLMEDNDVTGNNIFGTLAYFKTPTYSTNIYGHMDNYIAELINWKSSTSKLIQEGWLITHIAGCGTCGSEAISANSGVLVYADSSVFGNLDAHKVPGSGFNWVNGREELGETICNGGSNYIVAIGYGVGNIFNHNTSVSCSTSDNNNVVSNAGYFENWNTVASSNWSGDITDPVTMYSAYEGRGSTSNWLTWLSSTNQKETCTGSFSSTTALSGSLASGGTVTITPSGVPIAC
jgi:hypothetical protein